MGWVLLMVNARYVQLGFQPTYPTEDMIGYFLRDYVGPKNHKEASVYGREDDIYMASEVIAFAHLQLGEVEDLSGWIRQGLDSAIHYFLEDWWVGNARASKAVNKADPDRFLEWYKPFSRGLVLAILAEDWDSVSRLSSWVEADLVPEYAGMGGGLEIQVAQIYIVVAASLRSEPMPGLETLSDSIRKCRTKRPRLLMKTWDAVMAKDQSAFNVTLTASLQHFASSPKLENNDARLGDRLALPQTVIALAAKRHGLLLPELPEELSLYLITRESLGLPPAA